MANKYKIVEIQKEYEGLRLDKFLQSVFRNANNIIIQKAIRNKDILINGSTAQNSHRLTIYDNLELSDFIIKIFNSKPKNEKVKKEITIDKKSIEAMKDQIIYKDDYIIAINKPKGLAVQSGSKIEKSLNDYLKYLKFEKNENPKLIHRLDKDTSGVLILARTKNDADILSTYFKNKDDNLEKIYLALVVGEFQKKEGEINIKLIKKVENGIEKIYKDEKEGKEATTLYKVLDYSEDYNVSLVQLKLLTGRTHQIRVHMKEIGHPILGDGKYGNKKAFVEGLSDEMHLHAYLLNIKNFHDRNTNIKAELPEKFKKTLKKLKFKSIKIASPFIP